MKYDNNMWKMPEPIFENMWSMLLFSSELNSEKLFLVCNNVTGHVTTSSRDQRRDLGRH